MGLGEAWCSRGDAALRERLRGRGQRSEENAARIEPERGDAWVRYSEDTHDIIFRLRRSTTNTAKTRIGRVLRVPTRHGMDGIGRCVTQLTLGHDGVDGDEPAATRTSSEPGGADVHEAGEEEDDGEVAGLGDPRRGRGRRGRSRRRGGRRTCLARRRWPECMPAMWTRS